MADPISYLIFDVESVPDGELIKQVRYPGIDQTPDEAIATYEDELMESRGTTFIPHTFQVPIAVVIAKVAPDLSLIDLVSLDEPEFRPHIITDHFWRGWEMYKHPTWVTFNGRAFDVPIMELAAFRFGISIPRWFRGDGYKAPRNRFNVDAHLDLQDVITNFGAARCNGGLNLIAKLLGKPGKMDTQGDQVRKLYQEGKLGQISDYCRCDVLDTYFTFLRVQTLKGVITLEQEMGLVDRANEWISNRVADCKAYSDYLEHWSGWSNPWERGSEAADEVATPQ